MNRALIKKLVLWLRRKHPGAVVKMRDFWMYYIHLLFGVVPMSASLGIRVLRKNGVVEDKGIVCTHAVTDAFVAALVDTLQSSVATFSDYKYHDSGTDSTAEDSTDTALVATCGDARTTGTQIEGTTANIYKSVATHTYGGAYTIVEHGLFNAAAVGTLMDRSVFTGIGVAIGDKIEFTYQLTCTSGG